MRGCLTSSGLHLFLPHNQWKQLKLPTVWGTGGWQQSGCLQWSALGNWSAHLLVLGVEGSRGERRLVCWMERFQRHLENKLSSRPRRQNEEEARMAGIWHEWLSAVVEERGRVLEDVHAGTRCINNLISMLIILNCAHTQVEEVVCQNSRTEWSTAVCDSCVAQLGETDNPQPAGADKTATFLLRRMKIPSAGPCSSSLPPLCHALSSSLWKVGPLSSSLFVSPLHRSPLLCPPHISLQWTAA